MKTERELVEAMRDKLRRAEALIESALKDGKGVIAMNTEDAAKANAAFKAVALLNGGLAGLQNAHADATTLLLDNWPGFGGIVVLGGGGR